MKRGVSPDPQSIEASIGSLFKEISSTAAQFKGRQSSEENGRKCPACGTSFVTIKKTSTAGCPECYKAFKKDIISILERKGIKGIYTGTAPAKNLDEASILKDKLECKEKLDEAVRKEEYEKAAYYRDRLRALDDEAMSSGKGKNPGVAIC